METVTSNTSPMLQDPAQTKVGIVETPSAAELDRLLAEAEGGAQAGVLPSDGGGSSHRERAVRAASAKSRRGPREEPRGSNCQNYSRYFNKGCQPWCADFVSWAFDYTGNKDKKVPWGNPSSVAAINDWARSHNKMVRRPARGDIFTYRNNQHCGLVLKVAGNRFLTVEGNTTGPDGECEWVYCHWRNVDGPYYYVRIDF